MVSESSTAVLATGKDREFLFTEQDFQFIANLVAERTGIVLSDTKREMVYSRLTRRIRELKIADFKSYCHLLRAGDHNELITFTNAITTNLTSFFREPHHFEYLADKVLQDIKQNRANKYLRIWSAGCSSGEEPYTLAMIVREVFPESSGWNVKILATDLDTDMVEKARRGVYTAERVTGIDKRHLQRWFVKGKGQHAGKVKVKKELQSIISFQQLNLLHDWPFKNKMDIIFCRNVVIYFNKATQRILFDRYADQLIDHGNLFIGHSESLHAVTERFDLIGKSMYLKVK